MACALVEVKMGWGINSPTHYKECGLGWYAKYACIPKVMCSVLMPFQSAEVQFWVNSKGMERASRAWKG